AKDGVFVYRIKGENPCVLKCFEKDAYKREIENYRLLQSFGIETIHLLAKSEDAILMEDISDSKIYRLAIRDDMDDPEVMRALAKWYRDLHKKSGAYIRDYGAKLYCETDDVTLENIRMIKEKTQTVGEPVWALIEEHYTKLRELIDSTPKTLTYNDFYYTNMVVAKNKSEAFMFDYNLLGKGFACADLVNVTYELSEPAKTAFLNEYGEYDPKEMTLVKITGTLFALITACKRTVFPDWAEQELEAVKNGELIKAVEELFVGLH
ncbi:MAG TPA: hypothetical protein PLV03_07785, partial [Clostridiales bacterium]|nr:hypothetical protein [Clostridiales bacterium]